MAVGRLAPGGRARFALLGLLLGWTPLGTAPASAQPLKPGLAGLDFLLGRWTSAAPGAVADTGGSATGASTFTAEAGGQVILRRDHTELRDRAGSGAGGFDQLMMIWPEDGAVRADYADGTHLIHYVRAKVEPGRAVTFSSDAAAGGPAFRLGYRLSAPGVLAVSFGMVPPGGAPFRPIATGTLRKAP